MIVGAQRLRSKAKRIVIRVRSYTVILLSQLNATTSLKVPIAAVFLFNSLLLAISGSAIVVKGLSWVIPIVSLPGIPPRIIIPSTHRATRSSPEMNICGESRDLYADLQLPPTADAESIKKNFRDLALRVHPDHNSKDKKANEKFCAIKKAYDILSDPGKKAEYDASRRHRRYQGPSCPEDNPWSNVTPQQPNQARARATPWRAQDQRFSAGVPNSKQYTKSKAEAAQPRNGASATTTGGKRRTPHPPPPPTASARHRKEASFGSRRNGFHPWATQKDEAPATSSNYSSRPPPVPQGPTSTATTDPPVTESPQAMN
ncbi:C2H2 type master regulator of conidiophore development brlA, partial [Fusarium oxysporum f. sp. albedinis]